METKPWETTGWPWEIFPDRVSLGNFTAFQSDPLIKK